MKRRGFHVILAALAIATLFPFAVSAKGTGEIEGATVSGSLVHTLDSPAMAKGMPSLANITNNGMSCTVSFGNNLGGPDNFGMVIYSEEVTNTIFDGQRVTQTGKARSVTVENGIITEDALYDYTVVVIDGGAAGKGDSWSMTLVGDGLNFDGVTFSGGVATGDISIKYGG